MHYTERFEIDDIFGIDNFQDPVFFSIGKRDTVKKIILSLVIQAEKTLGSGTGDLKYAMVVERAYSVLPTLIRLLITKKELDNLIEEAVQYMKKQLQGGKSLLEDGDEYTI